MTTFGFWLLALIALTTPPSAQRWYIYGMWLCLVLGLTTVALLTHLEAP